MEDKAKEELRPCPFCGGEAKLHEGPNHVEVICYWIKCHNYKCNLSITTHFASNPKAAMKLWNKRAETNGK